MTDEQIRLYAVARLVAPANARISSLSEKTTGGHPVYTLIVDQDEKRRWFAIHSLELRQVISDGVLAAELRRVLAL